MAGPLMSGPVDVERSFASYGIQYIAQQFIDKYRDIEEKNRLSCILPIGWENGIGKVTDTIITYRHLSGGLTNILGQNPQYGLTQQELNRQVRAQVNILKASAIDLRILLLEGE